MGCQNEEKMRKKNAKKNGGEKKTQKLVGVLIGGFTDNFPELAYFIHEGFKKLAPGQYTLNYVILYHIILIILHNIVLYYIHNLVLACLLDLTWSSIKGPSSRCGGLAESGREASPSDAGSGR